MNNRKIDSVETNRSLETWEKLAKVYNEFSKQDANKVKSFGLTLPQFSIIESLGNLGSMKIGELNNSMIYNGGNMTLVLDQLEKMNYTLRKNSPTDRRAIIVELTDEGHKLFNKIYPEYTRNTKSKFENLSSKEVNQLNTLLSRLFD